MLRACDPAPRQPVPLVDDARPIRTQPEGSRGTRAFFDAPPQLYPIALSDCPLLVKPLEMQLERALAKAEYIRALTT